MVAALRTSVPSKESSSIPVAWECKYFAAIVTDLGAYLSNGGAVMEDLDDDSAPFVLTSVK